jgi:anaerobic C4-dicarboxylate transporter
MIFIQLAVLLVCIFIGARLSGIGLGVMGMIGLLIPRMNLRIDYGFGTESHGFYFNFNESF